MQVNSPKSIEKEIKILSIDKEKVIYFLSRFGCVWSTPLLYTDYYRENVGSLCDYTVRHRVISDGTHQRFLKKRISNVSLKVAEEIILDVANDSITSLLIDMGYTQTRIKQKIRTVCYREDMGFMIDEYPNIPPLLEIEGPDLVSIQTWVTLLHLHNHQQVTCGWNGLRKMYKKKNKENNQ